MLSAEMIPQFSNKTPAGARAWWDSMLEKGLSIHPEDDPANIVDAETELRLLDASACQKISSIYDEMFASIGESESYDIGMTAWYNHQGFEWNSELDEFVEIQT